MKDLTVFFLLLVILAVFYLYLEQKALQVIYIEAYDGKRYLVRDQKDKEDAAELLANIASNCQKLVTHVYNNRDSYSDAKRKIDIERLHKNFRPDAISESSPNNNYTSYSINKGEQIVLCLRNGDKLVDINTMMFVVLHEFAHLATESIGHSQEFWDNFKWILEESINIGIYIKTDYNKKAVEYCGMKINTTPLD